MKESLAFRYYFIVTEEKYSNTYKTHLKFFWTLNKEKAYFLEKNMFIIRPFPAQC